MSLKNSILPFTAGLLAGAAVGYYLNSDQGRAQVAQTKESVNELGTQINTTAKDQWNQLNTQMESRLHDLEAQIQQLQDYSNTQASKGKAQVKKATLKGLDRTITAADRVKTQAEEVKARMADGQGKK